MQCIGAVLGAGILHGCTPTSVSATLGANGLGPNNVTGVGLVAVSPGAGYHCTIFLKSDLPRHHCGFTQIFQRYNLPRNYCIFTLYSRDINISPQVVFSRRCSLCSWSLSSLPLLLTTRYSWQCWKRKQLCHLDLLCPCSRNLSASVWRWPVFCCNANIVKLYWKNNVPSYTLNMFQ